MKDVFPNYRYSIVSLFISQVNSTCSIATIYCIIFCLILNNDCQFGIERL